MVAGALAAPGGGRVGAATPGIDHLHCEREYSIPASWPAGRARGWRIPVGRERRRGGGAGGARVGWHTGGCPDPGGAAFSDARAL